MRVNQKTDALPFPTNVPILRDYQDAAVSSGIDTITHGKNGVIVMPTGSGKSLCIAGIAMQTNARIVVLQPTREILEQNINKLREFGFTDVAVCSASLNQWDQAQVTFATIGTIINRLDWFTDTEIVIVDECDLVNPKGGQYKQLISHFGVPTIGLTATPYRMASYDSYWDGRVVEAKFLHRTRPRVFDRISHITQNKDLHDQGYLASIDYSLNTDYDPYEIQLKSNGLNYDEAALAAYNRAQQTCKNAASAIVNNLDKINSGLIFTAFIDESKEIEQILWKSGVHVAHVDGSTPAKKRRQILENFKDGSIKVVVNVGVLTAGFDFPALDCVVLARPTMSLRLFYQMVGRGVRMHPDKERLLVVDLCGNVKKFGRPEKYYIEAPDNYKYRLRSGQRYLTNVNFITGEDLEKTRDKRQEDLPKDVVPFGKHKGEKVSEIPEFYLKWCVKNFQNGHWKDIFKDELKRRALS